MNKGYLIINSHVFDILADAISCALMNVYYDPFEVASLEMFLEFFDKHSNDDEDFILVPERVYDDGKQS